VAELGEAGRVLIAFDAGPLEPDPTWTRIDDTNSLVSAIEISTGRQTEFDQTDTGTATVHINDRTGLFDANNSDSPYFNKLDGKQIALQLWDPVTAGWYLRFRGLIDDLVYDLNPSTRGGVSVLSNVQLACVDVFDYLSGFEFLPGVHGNTVPAEKSAGTVFYEDGDIQDRFVALLTDAGLDPDRYVCFSGNVNVIETQYDPSDSIMVGLRDAADAEQAVLANIYTDRFGRFVFHGRFARLDPEGVIAGGPVSTDTWDFQTWYVGDAFNILDEGGSGGLYAQMKPPFRYRRPRSRIVNSALCYPRLNDGAALDEADIPGLAWQDTGSIDDYGRHSWSATDLIVKEHKTNGNTAIDECSLTGNYVVDNNKYPQERIEALTIKAVALTHDQAAQTHKMLARCDISDRVTLDVGYPDGTLDSYAGGTGVHGDYFIEGWTQTITPGSPIEDGGLDFVELTINVSPAPTVNVYAE
jgi:hypothetical protein